MIDQADKLRQLVEGSRAATQNAVVSVSVKNARVIAVTSGKGGVGKTNFTVNLAIQLARRGKKIVIIDADFGLANIDVLFGVVSKHSFADVLSGQIKMRDALTDGPLGIQFISGGSGMSQLADITENQMSYLLENFAFLDEVADIVLIDTGAGISKSVVNFVKASQETIIVTTPEPTSVTDAYAIIKTVREGNENTPLFKLVVNRVDDAKEGSEIFEKLNMVTQRFLNVTLENLGAIPYDNRLVQAVKKQRPVVMAFPDTASAKSIHIISSKLVQTGIQETTQHKEGVRAFMRRLSGIFGS